MEGIMKIEYDGKLIEVEDADEPIVLHITKRDTSAGKKFAPAECAAALSCRREPGVLAALVYRTRTVLLKKKGRGLVWKRYKTPESVRNELIAFDRGGEFMPGDYIVRPLGKNQQLGNIKQSNALRGDRKPKSPRGKRSPHVVQGVRPRAVYHPDREKV
jgi:hypothetical protein